MNLGLTPGLTTSNPDDPRASPIADSLQLTSFSSPNGLPFSPGPRTDTVRACIGVGWPFHREMGHTAQCWWGSKPPSVDCFPADAGGLCIGRPGAEACGSITMME